MSDSSKILELVNTDPEKCLSETIKLVETDPESLDTIQLAAEVFFELGNAEQAIQFLNKALSLDPTGEKGGYSKFLWMGQLEGGKRGIEWYERGLAGLKTTPEIIKGLLGMIEIWMTDLCMDAQAESQCEAIISRALLLDESHAESWSILGSIRISQQRDADAQEALLKSLQLQAEAITNGTIDGSSIHALVRLAQSMLEVNLEDQVLDLTAEIARLDDQVPDAYYLNAWAHKELINRSEDVDEQARHIVGARDALELLLGLEDVDSEMKEAAGQLLADLPEATVDVADSDEEFPDEE